MVSTYRKNIFVGLVAIAAIGVLGWMIIRFGDAPVWWLRSSQLHIRMVAERADGVGEGSSIMYRGIGVGRITRIQRSPTDPRLILMVAALDPAPPLPGNIEGRIERTSPLGNAASISLYELANDGSVLKDGQEIRAVFAADMFPPEFTEAAREMTLAVKQFRESNLVLHFDQTVRKAGAAIDSLAKVIDDPKLQDDLRQSLANIRTVTETASRAGANIEKFSQKLEGMGDEATATIRQTRATIEKTQADIDHVTKAAVARLEQTAKLIDKLDSIAKKVDEGKGTAGQFINDPRLYESLVDTSRELNLTAKDLKRLVEQWEQEGVTLKLK